LSFVMNFEILTGLF